MSTAIAEYSEFEAKMAEFKKSYDNVVYDLSDPVQEKKAKSDRRTIGTVISALDKKHDEIKAPLKAQVDLIDGERKRIKDELLGVQDKIKSQIKAHDEAIWKHSVMLQGKVDEIVNLGVFGEFETPTADQILERIAQIEEIDVDASYETRKADATLAKVDTLKSLNALYEKQKQYEEQQAELERLRKEKEERDRLAREEQIRKEAAEKAKREAEEAAERAALEAEQKAEKARQEAAEAARREQEAIQAEADRKIAEAKAKAEREAQEERDRLASAAAEEKRMAEIKAKAKREREAAEAKKKENQAHRAKIHKAAKASFVKEGFSEADATKIVELVRDGKIAHVVIEY